MIRCRLIERAPRAPHIATFRLAPEHKVPFEPGQYVRVLLEPGQPDNRELNKFLSLSCAPGRGHLEVTKKFSDSPFSTRLRALQPGDAVTLDGPFGSCTLRDDDRRAVFLGGGIGITPIISMVEHAVSQRPDLEMDLFWSNRRVEDFVFRTELEAWAAAAPRLCLHLFLTAGEPPDGAILPGRITGERLTDTLPELSAGVFFVFGPPPMVEAMCATLRDLGVLEDRIRSEGFAGA